MFRAELAHSKYLMQLSIVLVIILYSPCSLGQHGSLSPCIQSHTHPWNDANTSRVHMGLPIGQEMDIFTCLTLLTQFMMGSGVHERTSPDITCCYLKDGTSLLVLDVNHLWGRI